GGGRAREARRPDVHPRRARRGLRRGRTLVARRRRRARAGAGLAAHAVRGRGRGLPPLPARCRRLRAVRRRRLLWALAALLVAAVLFGVGVAVGEALHDNPRPGGRQTFT